MTTDTPINISVQADDFDLAAEMARLTRGRTDIGAVVSFVGLVRDFTDGRKLETLTLEHYPGMAEKQLSHIAAQAQARWPLLGLTVIHRYGMLAPGDQIVLVLATAPHRGAAFEAANFLMDWLKTDAPFWKKEATGQDSHWVEARTADENLKKRWD